MMNSIKSRDYASLKVVERAFGAREKTAVYESRIMKDLHRAFLTNNHNKYLFSDTTVVRASKMDIDKVTSESLCNIYLKSGIECGVIMLPSSYKKINFLYAILPTHILLSVYQGSFYDAQKSVSEDEFNVRFSNTHLGEVVITEKEIKISPFSVINILIDVVHTEDTCRLDVAMKDPLYGYQIRKAWREIKDFYKNVGGDIKTGNIDSHRHPFLFNECKRMESINGDLLIALKCFIFLKCAKVIDSTFIADNTPKCTYRRLKKDKGIDYIFIDGHYDENIKVINPFQVSGHFRNQPRKNEKGEWYKELIYIDSFMKQGYTRRATKEKIERSKNESYEKSMDVG